MSSACKGIIIPKIPFFHRKRFWKGIQQGQAAASSPLGESPRRCPWSWGHPSEHCQQWGHPGLAHSPSLGPTGLSREEPTGKVDLGLFPLLWTSAGGFGARWPEWLWGDPSQRLSPPQPSRSHGRLTGSVPQEKPGCRSSTTFLIHGTRAADLSWGCQAARGDPQTKENHPQIAEAGGALEAAPASPPCLRRPFTHPSSHLRCLLSNGQGFVAITPREAPLLPLLVQLSRRLLPECTKCGSPKMPARNSCIPPRPHG